SSASAGANRSWQTNVVPDWRALASTARPPTQKNGMARKTGPGKGVAAVLRNTVPWVWTTPLGSAVEPEVWMTTNQSAGTTSASTSASNSSLTPAASTDRSTDVAQSTSASPTTQIRRR